MNEKLEELCRRYDELTAQMSDPEIYADPKVFQRIAKESSDLEPIVKSHRTISNARAELKSTLELLDSEDDPELLEMVKMEVSELEESIEKETENLHFLLLPKDPNDEKNVILEIRAGTGGDEAALFSGDLFRMYSRFADKRSWRVEVMSSSNSETGGFKEVIAMVTGTRVYSTLKFESGVHRVQRVPSTESQGRIHTSACTVAILPEAEEVELNIPEKDLRFDVFRSSGPGGQSVNTTDSAVRITHLPTGLVVSCQDEKSQHKNKAKGLRILRSRILDKMEAEAHAVRADARKAQVGSGDRSERIRTYNYPQNRVTDHRIGLTVYRLDEIIEGTLELVVEPVIQANQAELLRQGQSG